MEKTFLEIIQIVGILRQIQHNDHVLKFGVSKELREVDNDEANVSLKMKEMVESHRKCFSEYDRIYKFQKRNGKKFS